MQIIVIQRIICGKIEWQIKETKLTYKKQGNITLFDNVEAMEKLNSMGNPLDKLSKAVDFEMFMDTLEKGLALTNMVYYMCRH